MGTTLKVYSLNEQHLQNRSTIIEGDIGELALTKCYKIN